MSNILRHRASDLGIPINESGWVKVEDLRECHMMIRLGVSVEEIGKTVNENDKHK